MAAQLGLVQITENEEYHRYLVTTVDKSQQFINADVFEKDVALGKIMGFKCANHDYWNDLTTLDVDRYRLGIYAHIKGS